MYCFSCGTQLEQDNLNIPICKNCALKVISHNLDMKQTNTIDEKLTDKVADNAFAFEVLKELDESINTPEFPIDTPETSNIPIENGDLDKPVIDDVSEIVLTIIIIFSITVITIGIIQLLNS